MTIATPFAGRRTMTRGQWLAATLLLATHVYAQAQLRPAPPLAPAPITLHDDRGRSVTLAAPAQRIVSLLPSLTETVCELGACARLVGTDRHSDWPAAVRALTKLGGLEDTQIERLAALQPDLVLVALSSRANDRLEALGLPVLALEPSNRAGVKRSITTLALALGTPAAGVALTARFDARVAAAAARVPAALRARKVYFEVASTPHAAGAASYVGELLAQLGLVNIVPPALGPFPQLSPEFVLRAEPAIVMATVQALAEMRQRPGWSGLAALRNGSSCGFAPPDWDALVRSGPRLADGAEVIADCLVALAGKAGADAPTARAAGPANAVEAIVPGNPVVASPGTMR